MKAFATAVAVILLLFPTLGVGHEFSALARAKPDGSKIEDHGLFGMRLTLDLSQSVLWRVFTLDNPDRVILDFQEVDWSNLNRSSFVRSENVSFVEYGTYIEGWSRMVAELASPLKISTAQMVVRDDRSAMLELVFAPTTAEEFASQTGAPSDPRWDLPAPADVPRISHQYSGSNVTVMIDPGHGGIDPGAQADDLNEKELTLRFARELEEELLRVGGFNVLFTRTADEFVSLERRVAMAQQAGADVFLSIHADALSEGLAHGASVHVLSEEASDIATEKLAERHDRADLLSGVDLKDADDEVARILLDIARAETAPRTQNLAVAMIESMDSAGKALITKPLRSANYSVLKAADIPSILIELGFMSSPKDLERLTDPEWRASMARVIRLGLEDWKRADEALRPLVRK